MLVLLYFRSLSLCAASFLSICIFILLCCCSYSLNSGSDLARLFHSVLYCCLLSFSLTDLSSHISLAAFCTLWQSAWFFLALSAKSFCDCKYLSTIACASEGIFVESTTAHSLFDNSPLFEDMHDAPSRLLFDICTSVSFDMLDLFDLLTSSLPVALACRLQTLSSFCRCVWLFFLTFGITCQYIDLFSTCQLIYDHIMVNFNRFRRNGSLKPRWRKVWCRRTYWTVTWLSCDLLHLQKYSTGSKQPRYLPVTTRWASTEGTRGPERNDACKQFNSLLANSRSGVKKLPIDF